MQIAIVTNSLAGAGKAIQLSIHIQRYLNTRKLVSEIFKENEWTNKIYHFDQIWIVGGDGTVNHFINQFHNINKPLCIFNGGTGNDFYALLYKPMTVENQINHVLQSKPRPIDAGRCNGRYFLNGVGIGFEGAVVNSLINTKKLSGKKSFMLHVLKHIFFYKAQRYHLFSEERKVDNHYFMISISNGKRYGGGFYIAPLAEPDDGLLEIILVKELSIFQRLKSFPLVEKGKHLSLPFVEYFRTRKISVAIDKGVIQAHLDGEYMEGKEFEIEILPGHFRFIY